MRPRRALAATLAVTALTSSAHAQDIAPPAEQGSTDQTRFAGQLGGTWSTGNSTSYSVNTQLRTSHRRGDDQITWSGALNYGRATAQPVGTEPDGPEHTYQSDGLYYTRLRYDRFFLQRNTAFVGALAFRDTSSGFRARYSPYLGYQRTFVATEAFELWLDVGYRGALEYLLLDQRAREDGLPERRWVHGPLITLGVATKLGETLDFDLGIEAQQNVNVKGDFRVFSVASLVNKVSRAFALGMNVNLRYLRSPIGDREPLDTQLQLVAILEHTIEPGRRK